MNCFVRVNYYLCTDQAFETTLTTHNMSITITPIGKTSPTNPGLPMLFYPKVIKTGETDLDEDLLKVQ